VSLSSQVPNCDEIRHSDANGTGEAAVEAATWTTCLSFLRRARGANYLRLVSHVVRSFVARRRPGAPANFGIKITAALFYFASDRADRRRIAHYNSYSPDLANCSRLISTPGRDREARFVSLREPANYICSLRKISDCAVASLISSEIKIHRPAFPRSLAPRGLIPLSGFCRMRCPHTLIFTGLWMPAKI